MAELHQWVKDRLRSTRTPESIDFWDELPYNETGKLLRREVREAMGGRDQPHLQQSAPKPRPPIERPSWNSTK